MSERTEIKEMGGSLEDDLRIYTHGVEGLLRSRDEARRERDDAYRELDVAQESLKGMRRERDEALATKAQREVPEELFKRAVKVAEKFYVKSETTRASERQVVLERLLPYLQPAPEEPKAEEPPVCEFCEGRRTVEVGNVAGQLEDCPACSGSGKPTVEDAPEEAEIACDEMVQRTAKALRDRMNRTPLADWEESASLQAIELAAWALLGALGEVPRQESTE